MKKFIMGVLVVMLVALGTSCSIGNVFPSIDTSNDDVCYYGCPNSKKVKKLITKKRKI